MKKLYLKAFIFLAIGVLFTGCAAEESDDETCDPNPCHGENRSICTLASGKHSCGCDEGFFDYGGGGDCLPLDPCVDDISCREEGRVCSNNSGVVECAACAAGFIEEAGECKTEVTFFAIGDAQYGGGSEDKNSILINGMNLMPDQVWPDDSPLAGRAVGRPLGLLVAGDLTQDGQDGRDLFIVPGNDQIGKFHEDYGLTGVEGLLKFPVYEGYGNHDFNPDEPDDDSSLDWRYYYSENATPAVVSVSERNPDRVGLLDYVKSDAGHYSWEWGRVHFVNVNIFPGDEPSDNDRNSRVRNPGKSLTFLKQDLAKWVGDSGRPVIIMAHYGFSEFSREPRWWTDEQREKFRQAVEGYNLIAYVHGHTHGTFIQEWEGFDIVCAGSPYYKSSNADGKGHFTVFNITDDRMTIHDAAAGPETAGGDPRFTGWSKTKEITTR